LYARWRLLFSRRTRLAGLNRTRVQQRAIPEAIHEDFPVQKLSTIYGAIAYYLNHKEKVDKYIEESRREFESHLVPLEQADPELWKRIQRARAKMHESHS
jgi:hypothetical protein